MLPSTTRRLILPFTIPSPNVAEIEYAAVFAFAELERNKGGGLIFRQSEERLAFLAKLGYPIWLYPKGDIAYAFDSYNYGSYSLTYLDLPSTKNFAENLVAKANPRENYLSFLSAYQNYFQQPAKSKQFVFQGLISDFEFKAEFNIYRKEATETSSKENLTTIPPLLEEKAIFSELTEFDKLQNFLREEAERLPESLRFIKKTTSQHMTEIDYEASAATEEIDAKIKAQEELVNPKVASLNRDYKTKIKNSAETFNNEIENLEKLKVKTKKTIEDEEEKIRQFKHDAKIHGEKKHAIYEKRAKEKIKQTKKAVKSFQKELKNIEYNLKKTSEQKNRAISKLNFELDAEIKLARQPLLELETARETKIRAFRQETDMLLKLESQVILGINKSIEQRDQIKTAFFLLSQRDPSLKVPTLFYFPFYVAGYETGLERRYFLLPPCTFSSVDLSTKIMGAFGFAKIKNLVLPRFKGISALISRLQLQLKRNAVFESQLRELSEKNNLLRNNTFLESAEKGLAKLKGEGWLSEKEQQSLSNRLKVL